MPFWGGAADVGYVYSYFGMTVVFRFLFLIQNLAQDSFKLATDP